MDILIVDVYWRIQWTFLWFTPSPQTRMVIRFGWCFSKLHFVTIHNIKYSTDYTTSHTINVKRNLIKSDLYSTQSLEKLFERDESLEVLKDFQTKS